MKKTILIIEDEKILRFLLTKTLKEADFEVLEAWDGEEGFNHLKTNKVDLILLDIILPGINGFEILSKLKNNPKTKNIPVIILSNLGQKEECEKGVQLGAVDYLIKSNFSLEEILEKIKKILKT